jgi:hypothetical protein
MGSDLLQSVVNDLMHQGLISRPIDTHDPDFPIVQYADDTLLIMPADKAQLEALKDMLNKFSCSTGLQINYSKSNMVPINVPDDLASQLASDFGCQIGVMPFTYLGLPLGTTKPQIVDLMPLTCRLERRLACSSSFLSQGARLQLINSALASMPLHFLCSLKLQEGFTSQLDRILRQCLWRDKLDEHKPSLAAWDMICRPKQCGGLGVINFQKQNAALLLKFLDKFYNRRDIPWVNLIWEAHYSDKIPHTEKLCGSFWWCDVVRLVDNFRGVAVVKHGKGDTFLFWSDNWVLVGDSKPMRSRFPRLFSYALDENIVASQVFNAENLTSLFHLPLSRPAFVELGNLQDLLRENPLTGENDV